MKFFLKLTAGVIVLLLVVVVGLLAWLLTFDANENKDWIAEKFREETGRELILGGNIEVTFYPWLGVTADDVSVGNATGFSNTPLLHADHLNFRVRLLPMLNREFEIDTVTLDGVHVNLEVAGDGRNNWQTLVASQDQAAGGQETSAPAAAPGGGFNTLIVGGVNINNASLVYHDEFANTHYEVNNFNMDIAELSYGDPLDISMSMDVASRRPELTATVNMDGTALYDVDNGRFDFAPLQLDATLQGPAVPDGSADLTLTTAVNLDTRADTLVLDDLRFNALGTAIAANARIERVQTSTPAWNAGVDVDGEDLAVLFRILEQEELAQRISSLESSYTISMTAEGDQRSGTVNLSAFNAELLNSDIEAAVRISNLNTDAQTLSGRINAAGPDLPTLVEVAGILQGGRDSALSEYGRELSRVPNKAYRAQSEFNIDMQQSTVDVPEFYLSLFGATITGNFDASNIEDTEAVVATGSVNAQGPDLPLLMQIAGQLSGGTESALNQYGARFRNNVRNRSFDFSTDFDVDMGRGSIELPTLNAAMLGFKVNGNLNASNIEASDGLISGALEVTGENLREVLLALEQPELAEVARSMALNVQVGGTSSNLRLSPFKLQATLAGSRIPDSPQTLTLDADTVLNLERGNLRAEAFSLDGLGLNLLGSVQASDIRGAMTYSGELSIPEFNARRFMQQLNRPLPPMTDPNTLQRVSLATGFGGTTGSFNLNNLQLMLDESTITGSLAVTDIATGAAQFNVNIDRIDADRYMNPATTAPVANNEQAEPLPVEQLREVNVNGSLNIGSLTVNRLNMRDIVVQLTAADGNIALNPFRASLYEGNFDGDIRLDASGSVPAATVSTTLSEVSMGPLLQDFVGSSYVSGTANIQLELQGSGMDAGVIKRSLNGNGLVRLEDGVLNGVDVAAVLNAVETMIRSRQVQRLPQGGSTPFEASSATLAIRNGVVSTNDLSIKAPGWQLTGGGTLADLATEMIDFRMQVAVDETTATSTETEYDLGGYTLPIACTGTIGSPRCLPDAEQIIRGAVSEAVTERLGDLLRDRLGGGDRQGEGR